jgi:hypothetical protein
MNEYRKWILQTCIISLLVVLPFLGVTGFNYWIDPLWLFSHHNSYNDVQNPFDERLLKTNNITFGKQDYNSLLLGSSRVTYINEHEFPTKVFNYAVSSMLVEEYNPFIMYAEKVNKKNFDTIYLGLDFWGTNVNRPKGKMQDLKVYINKINQPFYRTRQLFSFNTFNYAKQNFYSSKENKILFNSFRAYNRENIATARDVTLEEKEKFLNDFRSENQKETYVYDPTYKNMLLQLKKNHPNSKFVVFLTPVFKERWELEFQTQEKWNDYKRWVSDVVEVFGECTDFMTVNSITTNIENFYDTQHAYPKIGAIMVKRIIGKNENIPSDFGLKISNKNLNKTLYTIEMQRKIN